MLSPPRRVDSFACRDYFVKSNGYGCARIVCARPAKDGITAIASHDRHIAGIALRYATAAFELAAEERGIDTLASDLAVLKSLLARSEDLTRLVRSPMFSRADQAKGMEEVLRQAGIGSLTRNLVLLLVRKRRLFALGDVIRAYEMLLAKHRGEVAAEVTSARELKDDEFAELKRVLKDRLGREPRVTAQVDPSLLGGLKVKLGSRMIDTSLRTKLEAIRAAMKGA
jgi:F-type H+-transporting ATPase subunit delta